MRSRRKESAAADDEKMRSAHSEAMMREAADESAFGASRGAMSRRVMLRRAI